MITPLDHLREAARLNRFSMPVFAMFHELFEKAPIVTHRWEAWDHDCGTRLPKEPVAWPDMHFCVFAPVDVVKGSYTHCIAAGDPDTEVAPWFENNQWQLDSLMVFTRQDGDFDVIPLTRPAHGGVAYFPEVQLHFSLVPEQGWGWRMSPTGFVNPYVYLPLMRDMSEEEMAAVEDDVNHLGNMVELYLGSYYQYLQQSEGAWRVVEPKPAKVKKDDKGRLKKVHRISTAGYSIYETKKC